MRGKAGGVIARRHDRLYGWGNNGSYEITSGASTPRQLSHFAISYESPWLMASAGNSVSLAIREDKTLWSWGHSVSNGLNAMAAFPTQVLGQSQVLAGKRWHYCQASVGGNACAITDTGELYIWGVNLNGGLPEAASTQIDYPQRVAYSVSWAQAKTNAFNSAAMTTSGVVYTCGRGQYGALGLGSTYDVNYFSAPVISDCKAVIPNGDSCFALKNNGELYGWGLNYLLGTQKNSPVRIGEELWDKVAVGYSHIVAIKPDGTLWAWGDNNYGQVGNGTQDSGTTPILLSSDLWIDVGAANVSSFAIRADGTLWGWGNNTFGNLGDGTEIGKLAPQQLPGNQWSAIYPGSFHTFGISSER